VRAWALHDAPGEVAQQALGGLRRPRVDEDVAHEVGVQRVRGGQRDLVDAIGELAHRAGL
jgi:hypothetical protein